MGNRRCIHLLHNQNLGKTMPGWNFGEAQPSLKSVLLPYVSVSLDPRWD